MSNNDIAVLRDLARQYMDIAAKPIQAQRRRQWADHNSLRPVAPLVLATFGMWNVWCREVFADDKMLCRDPFFRDWERTLRMQIFHDSYGDDFIMEPWITLGASQERGWGNLWGLGLGHIGSGVEGGAWKFDPQLKELDPRKLSAPMHKIDENATAAAQQKLTDAIGDILPVHVDRGPAARGFLSDISTMLIQLRGLEQVMIDMYESPRELHEVLAFMRDGILANQAAAEKAGDLDGAAGQNQCMTYCHELPAPNPATRGVNRKSLWGYCAAQEFTLISPAMHDEFLLQYQKPIIETWGLSAYGCCEDLTRKIDMLRQIKNLRIIAVTPRADVKRCAEQIGTDYVMSWRPNPADMVCCGWNEGTIRRILREGLAACRGGHVHIHLKDVETLEGDTTRLARWVQIVRDEVEKAWD